MGDWMTVNIYGHIDPEDVPAAHRFIDPPDMWADGAFHCLINTGGLAGLGLWIPASGGPFSAFGNLAERNYSVQDVADTVTELARVAPSLALKIMCGGPYESLDCVATILAGGGMPTMITGPEVERLEPIPDAQMTANLIRALTKGNP